MMTPGKGGRSSKSDLNPSAPPRRPQHKLRPQLLAFACSFRVRDKMFVADAATGGLAVARRGGRGMALQPAAPAADSEPGGCVGGKEVGWVLEEVAKGVGVSGQAGGADARGEGRGGGGRGGGAEGLPEGVREEGVGDMGLVCWEGQECGGGTPVGMQGLCVLGGCVARMLWRVARRR